MIWWKVHLGQQLVYLRTEHILKSTGSMKDWNIDDAGRQLIDESIKCENLLIPAPERLSRGHQIMFPGR